MCERVRADDFAVGMVETVFWIGPPYIIHKDGYDRDKQDGKTNKGGPKDLGARLRREDVRNPFMSRRAPDSGSCIVDGFLDFSAEKNGRLFL